MISVNERNIFALFDVLRNNLGKSVSIGTHGTAFLTCSYLSEEDYDYRSFPLMKLEEELVFLNYKSLVAIASEDVVFPNGTLNWFIEKGYIDLGEVCYEERDFARMHLVKKDL